VHLHRGIGDEKVFRWRSFGTRTEPRLMSAWETYAQLQFDLLGAHGGERTGVTVFDPERTLDAAVLTERDASRARHRVVLPSTLPRERDTGLRHRFEGAARGANLARAQGLLSRLGAGVHAHEH